MIWAPEQTLEEGTTDVVDGLLDELHTLCGDVLPADGDKLEDIACAIEDAIRDRDGVEALDSDAVLSLAARALSSIGEDDAARRLFLFGSGMVRPSDWNITGDQTLWVLDLALVASRPDPLLELCLFGTLDRILESISDVWDETDGRGVLGLAHMTAALGGRYGLPRAMGSVTVGEILAACATKLRGIGREKGWREVPEVLSLDIWRAEP